MFHGEQDRRFRRALRERGSRGGRSAAPGRPAFDRTAIALRTEGPNRHVEGRDRSVVAVHVKDGDGEKADGPLVEIGDGVFVRAIHPLCVS